MTRFKMRILGAIPNGRIGQEFCYSFVFILSLLTLSGCVTSSNPAPLAPVPPIANHNSIEDQDAPLYAAHYFAPQQDYMKLDQAVEAIREQPLDAEEVLALKGESDSKSGCRLKDRFDRKALIAYEWSRNRMALDVDGIVGGSGDSGMRLEYKVRLQPEKTKKQKCRYNARWQGLLGSGYNEFIVRKDDTVWTEIRQKRSEGVEFISSLF